MFSRLLVLLLVVSLTACAGSLERVRPQAVFPGDAEITGLRDQLAILTVQVNDKFHVVHSMLVTNLETNERYSLPFFGNVILGSKKIPFEYAGTNKDVMQQYLFLDLPPARYQINSVSIRIEGSPNQTLYDFENLAGVYFEFEMGGVAYLGELFIDLGYADDSRAFRPTRTAEFVGSMNKNVHVPTIRSRYPAVSSDIQEGRVWKVNP